jgi:hypothetical protein
MSIGVSRQLVTPIDTLDMPLSNSKNYGRLSCTYQELFKKYPDAFSFGMGSSLEDYQTENLKKEYKVTT